MSTPALSAGEDWAALRRRFAGEALARVLAYCGFAVEAVGTIGRDGALVLKTEERSRRLETGPVALFWRGAPLDGEPPDWPREVSEAAARFFLTARPLAEAADLDFDLAARRDGANPHYFTCYTEKRLRALLSRREPEGCSVLDPFTGAGRALALAVERFPAAARRAAEDRDPFPVNRCARALAGAARDYLRAGGEHRPLLAAAETALANALGILMGELPGRGRPRDPDVRCTPQAPIYQRMT